MSNGGLRLNLGAGGQTAANWISVDRAWPPCDACDINNREGVQFDVALEHTCPRPCAFMTLDLAYDRWPFQKAAAEAIVLHHVLDLLTPAEMTVVLERCYRTLAPGGMLRASNANLGRGVQAAIDGDWAWFPEQHAPADDDVTNRAVTLFGFLTQFGARKQNLTVMQLQKACERAGFQTFALSAHGHTTGPGWMTELDSREAESWYCEATR